MTTFCATFVLISLALLAYLSVLMVWLYCSLDALTVAIMAVREFPDNPSFNSRVNLELRYGMYMRPFALELPCLPSAFMQLASASKLLLMFAPSRSFCPLFCVSAARSLPARSTSESLPHKTCLSLLLVDFSQRFTLISRTACERLDVAFASV